MAGTFVFQAQSAGASGTGYSTGLYTSDPAACGLLVGAVSPDLPVPISSITWGTNVLTLTTQPIKTTASSGGTNCAQTAIESVAFMDATGNFVRFLGTGTSGQAAIPTSFTANGDHSSVWAWSAPNKGFNPTAVVAVLIT